MSTMTTVPSTTVYPTHQTVWTDTRPDTFRSLVETAEPARSTMLLGRDGSLILATWYHSLREWTVHVSVPLFPPF